MKTILLTFAATWLALFLAVEASSHSEAPGTVTSPRSDIVDFYMFSSWERAGFTTFIVNVNPLQETFGGPNYSPLPSDFVFNIHVDNDGDAQEDITFQFMVGANFSGTYNAAKGYHEGLTLDIGPTGNKQPVKVPLAHIGQVHAETAAGEDNLNYKEHYKLRIFTGSAASNNNVDSGPFATNTVGGSETFRIPFSYAGIKTFNTANPTSTYTQYADRFIHNFNYPGATGACATGPSKVFVGQRADPFVVNLGQVFDLVSMVPVQELGGTQNDQFNVLKDKSVTSFVVEVHNSCVRGTGNNPSVIGGWASVQHLTHEGPTQIHTAGAQKNRLGNPLVNEVLIGLTDKNTFNSQHPSRDRDFLQYFEYPTVPELVEILWGPTVRGAGVGITGTIAPTFFPRADLRIVLLQGIPGLNQLVTTKADASCSPPVVIGGNGPLADMIRLNLDTPAVAPASQNSIGVIAGDAAGYPNGRRPGDDVVDIVLRVAMGKLCQNPFNTTYGICQPADAVAGGFTITDRAPTDPTSLRSTFPYLNPPTAGSDLRCGNGQGP